MRLDFNIIVIDDAINDHDDNISIKKLIELLKTKITDKGFEPKVEEFDSIEGVGPLFTNQARRIDLCLSDNNLGDAGSGGGTSDNGGIEFYLDLKNKVICDFVLYTRSDKREIVRKLVTDLNERQDPNLFSRFTFASRSSGDEVWHEIVINLVDHILSKREEINNLRGLYAQLTAKMHLHLRSILGNQRNKENHELSFSEAIEEVFKQRVQGNQPKYDMKLKGYIEHQRAVRNGLIHGEEHFCEQKKQWYIEYTKNGKSHKIEESNFNSERKLLKNTLDSVLLLK